MSEQNNIDEIKEALAATTPGPWTCDPFINGYGVKAGSYYNQIALVTENSGINGDREQAKNNAHLIAKAPEYITYLLQEAEFWKQAAENQRENNYELLKKQAILKDALEEIELILTDDTSTQAIEINQVINRAREAL